MSNVTHINGHNSFHALQELRTARLQTANALHVALTHLAFARQINAIHALGLDLPSDKPLAEALDHLNKIINPPPQAA